MPRKYSPNHHTMLSVVYTKFWAWHPNVTMKSRLTKTRRFSSFLLLSSFCQPVWNATLCQSSVVKRICWLFFKNHCYADDIQLYITIFKSQCVSKVLSVQNCFNCIKSRMSDNFYSQQNENKTQIFSCISQKPDAVHQNIVFLRLKTLHSDEQMNLDDWAWKHQDLVVFLSHSSQFVFQQ